MVSFDILIDEKKFDRPYDMANISKTRPVKGNILPSIDFWGRLQYKFSGRISNFSDFDNFVFFPILWCNQSQPRKAVIIAFDAPIDEDRKIPVRNYEIRLMASHLKDSKYSFFNNYSFFITGYILEVVRN